MAIKMTREAYNGLRVATALLLMTFILASMLGKAIASLSFGPEEEFYQGIEPNKNVYANIISIKWSRYSDMDL